MEFPPDEAAGHEGKSLRALEEKQLAMNLLTSLVLKKRSYKLALCAAPELTDPDLVGKMKAKRSDDIGTGNQFIDLELKGCNYTWVSNPGDGQDTKQKIDRIIANWDWLSMFPHAIGIALPIINSDHSPLVLKPKPPLRSGKQFKYEAFWEENEQCREVVADGWNVNFVGTSEWDNIQSKLRNCQRKLSNWHHATFKNAAREILNLKANSKRF